MKKFYAYFNFYWGILSCKLRFKNRDKTFVGSPQDGIDSTLTYTYQGDKVLTQTAKTLFLMTNWGLQRRGKNSVGTRF